MVLRIAFDLDDTLLDWRESFRLWMAENAWPTALDAEAFTSKTFKEAWPGISGARLRELGESFNASPSFRTIRVLPGVVETLRAVRAAGHSCSAITAPGMGPEIVSARSAHLDALGFSERVLLPYQADKSQALLEAGADVLVDDNPSTLLSALAHGIAVVVRDLPSNRNIDAPRISSWSSNAFADALRAAMRGRSKHRDDGGRSA